MNALLVELIIQAISAGLKHEEIMAQLKEAQRNGLKDSEIPGWAKSLADKAIADAETAKFGDTAT